MHIYSYVYNIYIHIIDRNVVDMCPCQCFGSIVSANFHKLINFSIATSLKKVGGTTLSLTLGTI